MVMSQRRPAWIMSHPPSPVTTSYDCLGLKSVVTLYLATRLTDSATFEGRVNVKDDHGAHCDARSSGQEKKQVSISPSHVTACFVNVIVCQTWTRELCRGR